MDEDGGNRDQVGHHWPNSTHQLQVQQVMDKTGDMWIILNGDNSALEFSTSLAASQVSLTAESGEERGGMGEEVVGAWS